MNKLFAGLTCLALTIAPVTTLAGEWVLDGASSAVSFGSIKKDTTGESHLFETLSGTVTADGAVDIDIDLASVQTWIDIRNERMIEFVFNNLPGATISATVDMDKLGALGVGDIMPVEVKASLSLMGNDIAFDAPMIAARLGDSRVMLVSDGMVFLSTTDLGIDAGIDKLMELAKLPGITRAVPVTARLVFDAAK